MEHEIIFNRGKIPVLVIFNEQLFSTYLIALKEKEKGIDSKEGVELSYNNQTVVFSQYATVIFDVFDFEINQKKILNALILQIEKAFNDDYNKKLEFQRKISYYSRLI